jgi:CRISPR-associated endonuclease/helicase Cas3
MISKLPDKLLAKSKRGDKEPITLEAHLRDAERCAAQIFRLDGRWGQNWCRFFKIQGNEAQQKFLLNLRVAALFHDIGKANEEFYKAVSGGCTQTFRHEHISALILHLKSVRSWLQKDDLFLDVEVITAAVLSHHLKASEKGDHRWGSSRKGERDKSVPLYLLHDEVKVILQEIARLASLDKPPEIAIATFSQGAMWSQAWEDGMKAAKQLKRHLTDERKCLLLAVKAGLIVSDAAASGLVREDKKIDEWIEEVVHSKAIASDQITKKIINQRIEQIKKAKGNFKWDEFQELIAHKGSRVLLLAACGSGKTLAAWKWAEEQVKHHTVGKVIFLYPTRGTATEGFKDYVSWAPEADAALVTGTARYELEAIAENPPESMKEKDFTTEDRLFSLGFWSRRYFSATVDQFLGFMEHSYGGICLLPTLADSVLIIDEIHSFDRKMFDSLIAFLKHFDLPVLCMTATLPICRKDELVKVGLKVYPTESDRENLQDLKKKENYLRYRLELVDNFTSAFSKAIQAYRQGERVLWVVNTVDRCLAISKKLADELKVEVLTYHSRFRLKDRQKVHTDTVKSFAFQKDRERKPAIAVTTQVCEMSLDLDADVLITEFAPIPSLVQRFGRANRHLVRGDDFRATLHIYQPPKALPYKQEELNNARKFLNNLGNGEISQKRLADAMEKYTSEERNADGSSPFLDSGYFATMGSFRDTDEYAVPCILDRDLDEVKQLMEFKPKKPYDGFIINVPHNAVNPPDKKPSWLPKYLRLAQWEGNYDERSGFSIKNLEEVDLG